MHKQIFCLYFNHNWKTYCFAFAFRRRIEFVLAFMYRQKFLFSNCIECQMPKLELTNLVLAFERSLICRVTVFRQFWKYFAMNLNENG